MAYEYIDYGVRQGVAWLRLNRPDTLNAFIPAMNGEIGSAVKEASADKEVRCLVITGEGRAFSSGQDLSVVNEEMDHGQVLRDHYIPMMLAIRSCPKPIVAGLNGVAAGAGLSLALACDFRIISEKASLVNAFIHVGLIPDAGNLYHLQKLIGKAKAMELSVLGEKVSAEQAYKLGLATSILPSEQFNDGLSQFAGRLASLPTKAIDLIKKQLDYADRLSMEDYLIKEAESQRIAGMTADHREGVQAFLGKRQPQFIGR
ncbi:MAG: enoyl-CoA hydratase-related protein [Bacillus sp. (in: firmicutes)]